MEVKIVHDKSLNVSLCTRSFINNYVSRFEFLRHEELLELNKKTGN